MKTIEALDHFFESDKVYLILGDPFHGSNSLMTLLEYCNKKNLTSKDGNNYHIIIESPPEISKTMLDEVIALQRKGFSIIPGENEITAPKQTTDEWLENERVPVANDYWTSLAISSANKASKVIICCGTSHVGPSQEKKGPRKEAGLIARLADKSVGYAVAYGEGLYTPEENMGSWQYQPIKRIAPLSEDSDSDSDSESDFEP
ncbi:hypothetical protein [Pseudomonas sp. LRF_L74]|uniref:hypothetical protein n=1 Tax=Pseudomonas sp. LRF_L74 TaxID=3369422 RepID=UPI003F62C0EF